MCKEYSAVKVPARAQKANGSSFLPLPPKNQRLRGAHVAWAPKNSKYKYTQAYSDEGYIERLMVCPMSYNFIFDPTRTLCNLLR